MPCLVLQAAAELRAAISSFETGEYSPADCFRIADELARTEKACAAARVLAAARAAKAGVPEQQGHKDGASWLARQSGTTPGQARQALDTAGRLDNCPDTRSALQSGDISLAQNSDRPGGRRYLPWRPRHYRRSSVTHLGPYPASRSAAWSVG